MRALTAFICLASLLTACGFKGPLYLPKPTAPAQVKASAASSSANQ
ncbi:LPS translocon maturation chaperone LptM [Chitinibacter fontanus]